MSKWISPTEPGKGTDMHPHMGRCALLQVQRAHALPGAAGQGQQRQRAVAGDHARAAEELPQRQLPH